MTIAKSCTALCVVSFALALIVASPAISADTNLTDRFKSVDEEERIGAMEEMLAARRSQIASLIAIVSADDNKMPENAKYAAAYLLGELRAVEAIPALIDGMCKDVNVRNADDERYLLPFDAALIKIGRSTIEPLLERLASASDAPTINKCSGVLVNVCVGKRRTLEVLHIAYKERAKDRLAQTSIGRAIEIVEGFSEPLGEPKY